jgi:hypothetical protein
LSWINEALRDELDSVASIVRYFLFLASDGCGIRIVPAILREGILRGIFFFGAREFLPAKLRILMDNFLKGIFFFRKRFCGKEFWGQFFATEILPATLREGILGGIFFFVREILPAKLRERMLQNMNF